MDVNQAQAAVVRALAPPAIYRALGGKPVASGPAAGGVTTANSPTQPTDTGSATTPAGPTDPTTAALAGLGDLFTSAFANGNGGGGTLIGASAPTATDLATADQIAANQAAAQANPPAPSKTKGLVVLAGVVGVAYLAYRHFKRQAAA